MHPSRSARPRSPSRCGRVQPRPRHPWAAWPTPASRWSMQVMSGDTEHTTPVRTTDPAVKGAAGLRSASYSGIGLRPFGRQACGASPIA